MGSEWPTVRLGDHVDACLGKMLDKKKNQGTLHPYLGNKQVRWGSFDLYNLSEMRFEDHEHERYGLRFGDLVVCEGGEPGRCALWRNEVPNIKIQKALHRIRPNPELVSTFLHYWFFYAGKFELLEPYFTGTTIKHLTGKAVAELPIPLPPLPEQKAIAHILGSLDDKIELNRRMNETLEEMARALFKSWFVDFDPVRAKMEGRKPAGMDDATAALFPDSFEESELGEIPKGWEVCGIADIGDVVCGKTPRTSDPENYGGEMPFITIPDMHGRLFAGNTKKSLSVKGANSQRGKVLPKGAICVSCIATPGLVVIVSKPSQTNQQINSVVPAQLTESFYWYHVLETVGAEIALAGSGGSVFANLSKGRFEQLSVICAPTALRLAFSEGVDPMLSLVHSNCQQSQTLAQLRDTLLPKLLSGDLDVSKVEKQLEETT